MKALYLLIIAVVLTSCHSKNTASTLTNSVTQQVIIDTTRQINRITKRTILPTDEMKALAYYIWDVDFEAKTMKRNRRLKTTTPNLDSIIHGLNIMYPNIPLSKVKQTRDTLFVEISNSTFLTQRMGTTGAATYLANAVINLTSAKGFTYVKLNFEEGDHASPGIWSRKDFNDIKEVR